MLEALQRYTCTVFGLVNPSGTIIQLATSAGVPIIVLKARLFEQASTTSTKVPFRLVTWGTAMSAGNTGVITKLNPGYASAAATALTWKTGQTEGLTETDLDGEYANFLAPEFDLDIPQTRRLIAVSSNVAIYAPSLPAGTFGAVIDWAEVK